MSAPSARILNGTPETGLAGYRIPDSQRVDASPTVPLAGYCASMSARRGQKEPYFTGRRVRAREALALGMVNKVVLNDELTNATYKEAASAFMEKREPVFRGS